MVGLIPLFAVEVLEPELLAQMPAFATRLRWVLENRADMAGLVSRWFEPGRGERRLLSLMRGHRIKKCLKRVMDEEEFLSPFGVRGLSRYHRDNPYHVQDGRPHAHRRLRAGRFGHGHVRRQLELARPGVVPGELPHHREPAEVPPLLRPGLPDRVPGGQREDDHGAGRGDRADAATDAGVPARRGAGGGRASGGTRRCRPTRTSATTCCSTSSSTATTAPGWGRATRPAGRRWWRSC